MTTLVINTRYDCEMSGHIVGPWYPYHAREGKNPAQKFRQCVVPGCNAVEVIDVTA